MAIISSILDSDLYKFSMMAAVLELFPETVVKYRFTNRGTQRFNQEFLNALREEINSMKNLHLTDEEYIWFKKTCPYIKSLYFEYLKNYRFNPSEVKCGLTEDNNLWLEIEGKWVNTILWEVPLMAIISELYFKIVDNKSWKWDAAEKVNYRNKTIAKFALLKENMCPTAEFGTRRRRSRLTQECVMEAATLSNKSIFTNFTGTSNVDLARRFHVTPIGTMGHEIIMAMQSLYGLAHCNKFAMEKWNSIYKAELGIILPDTITLDMFLKDFDKTFAMLYSGIRHDSGPYKTFVDKIIEHYKKVKVNPMSKFVIFSDALDPEKAVEIRKYCEGKINSSFAIGTNFTNDFDNSPALNMVIKLTEANGVPCVKISDSPGKEMGDPKMIEYAKYLIERNTR